MTMTTKDNEQFKKVFIIEKNGYKYANLILPSYYYLHMMLLPQFVFIARKELMSVEYVVVNERVVEYIIKYNSTFFDGMELRWV